MQKIKTGKMAMKPRWEFVATMWAETAIWLGVTGLMAMALVVIGYFFKLYSPGELSQFGDLGWQIFYEDFPYYWIVTSIFSLIAGGGILLKIGNNYKRSWQKNSMISAGVALGMAALVMVTKLWFQF